MSGSSPRSSRSSLHFSAGLATGVLSASLLQPADLLKTRVQQSPHTTLLSTLTTIARGPNALRSLWRGTLPSTIRTGFGSALYFSFLDTLRRSTLFTGSSSSLSVSGSASFSKSGGSNGGSIDKSWNGSKTWSTGTNANNNNHNDTTTTPSAPPSTRYGNINNMLSGALARTAAGFVLMPVTVIKVRYESSLYAYTSLPSAAASILRAEGARGFFSGFGATAARDAPYAGLYVLFYEQARGRLGHVLGAGSGAGAGVAAGEQAPYVNFAAGVVAACVATAVTNPFDAVKTRLQLRPREYGHMGRAAARMIREEGFRSLFDGLGLRVARKAMSSAIAWSLYEELVKAGEGRWIWAAPMEDGRA